MKESLFSRRSTYALFLLFVLASGLMVSVKLVRERIELRKKAAPLTSVSLTADSSSVTVGQNFIVDVNMNSGTNQLRSAKLVLGFDAYYLEAVSVTRTDLFPQTFDLSSTIENGLVTINIPPPDTLETVTGSGSVAEVVFRSKFPVAQTTIGFVASQTSAQSLDEPSNPNVITSMTSVPLTILAQGGVTPETTLSFDGPFPSGDDFRFTFNINTGTNKATVIDSVVSYDPLLFDFVSFGAAPGGHFNYIIKSVVNNPITGKIDFSYSVTPAQEYFTGSEAYAQLILRPLNSQGSSILSYANPPETTVTAIGTGQSVLTQTFPLSFSFGGASPTPAPTATPGPTASPSVDPTPTSSPQPTPSNTGGTEVTASPIANPSPGPGCTAYKPNAPTGVSAVSGTELGTVVLNWNKQSSTTHYRIIYGIQPGYYIYGAENIGNVGQYTIRQLTPGKRYYIKIYSVNGCMPSEGSIEVNALAKGYTSTGTNYRYPTPTPYNTNYPSPSYMLYPSPSASDVPEYPIVDVYESPIPSATASGFLAGFSSGSFIIDLIKILLIIICILLILYLIYSKLRSDREEEEESRNQ